MSVGKKFTLENVIGFSERCDHFTCSVELYMAKVIIIVFAIAMMYSLTAGKRLSDRVMTVLSLISLLPLLTGIYGYIDSIFDMVNFNPLYLGMAITIVLLVLLALMKNFSRKMDRML